jgi:hypothetical protein
LVDADEERMSMASILRDGLQATNKGLHLREIFNQASRLSIARA